VPFSPFGIATVSRQVEPQLPEFLYALSQSDGADPTRDYDTGRWSTDPDAAGVQVSWPDRPAGPWLLAAADRRPDRSAAGQYPGRFA
jgi:hypothetical protein